MGYFDNLPDENVKSTSEKPVLQSTSKFFNSLPEEKGFPSIPDSTIKDEPFVQNTTIPTKDPYVPKPGDAGYYDSEAFKTKVVEGYDKAPDKFKYKKTLSNLELDVINSQRPENKQFGSISEKEKQAQRQAYSAKISPGSVTFTPDTKLEQGDGKSLSIAENRLRQAQGSITKTVAASAKNVFDSLLDETPTEKAIGTMKAQQNLIESTQRQEKRKETVSEYIPEVKKRPITPTEGGEFYKSLKQGLLRDVPRNFFSSVEALTAGDGSMQTVNEFAAEQADKFLADRLLHPEENAPEGAKDLLNGGYKDPEYWKRGAGQMLSTMIPAFASSIGVFAATKNPVIASRVGLGSIYTQETGQAYADLIDSGFSPSDSQKGAMAYGVVATALESVNFGKTLNKVMSPTKSTMARESFKKALIDTIKEGGIDILKESGTEGMQQFSQNVMKKWYDNNQDLLEGVADSMALGALGGVGFAGTNAVVDFRDKYLENLMEARKIVNGEKTVSDEEMQGAALAIQKFQEKTQKTAISLLGENSSVKIKTVTYDDGKVSSSADITSGNDSITIPFSNEFSSKEEAIKSAAEEVKNISESVLPIPVELTTQIEEVIKSPEQYEATKQKSIESEMQTIDSKTADMETALEIGVNEGLDLVKVTYDDKNNPGQAVAIYEKPNEAQGYGLPPTVSVKRILPNPTTDVTNGQEVIPDAIETRPEEGGGVGIESDTTVTSGEGTPSTIEPRDGLRDDGSGIAKQSEQKTEAEPTPERKPSEKESKTSLFGKTARAKLNTEVKRILEGKDFSTDTSKYTEAELAKLKEYSGAGGKADKGASGRGLLDEFYTPREVVKNMWDLADKLSGRKIETVLEPSVGVGRFIEFAPKGAKVTGIELDKTSGAIAKINHPNADIRTETDFQTLFIDKSGKAKTPTEKFDAVVGNPPYGDRAGLYKGLGEESAINRWEEYFIKRGLDLTNTDGVLVYIVPSSFLDKGISKAKTAIAKDATLVDAYRMPEGIFEDTSVGTDIVVFKKGQASNPEDLTNGKFFESNPSKILGEKTTRKNRFGKEETAIIGDKEAAFEKLSSVTPKEKTPTVEDSIITMELTEGALKGKIQAFVESGTNKGKYAIGETKADALSKLEKTINGEPVEKVTVAKPTVTGTTKKIEKIQKPEGKVVDVSGIETIDYQVLNAKQASEAELEIFKNQNADLSVRVTDEIPASWMPYLNYENGKWYHEINYYSGDVRIKLDNLERDKKLLNPDQYAKQKAGLTRILPVDRKIADVTFDPLDRFVMQEPIGEKASVYVSGEGYVEQERTLQDGFIDWLYRSLDRRLIGNNVEKADIQRYINGERQRANTKEITGYIKTEAKRLLNVYIRDRLDSKVQDRIIGKYNADKNSYVRPNYATVPVEIKGMATTFHDKPFSLTETQQQGVGFLTNKGSGLVAYGVGVGKTHTLLVSTIANMQKGYSKRPLFIVPSSTLDMWVTTTQQMFPGIKVNNIAGLQAPVVSKLNKLGTPSEWVKDGEVTFISHEGILRLGFTEKELFEVTKDLNDALGTFDRELSPRELEQNREKAEEILGKSLRGSTDISVADLGFDHISVDEVHNFRKVFQGAKVEGDEKGGKKRFGNVIGGQPSRRAQKLFLLSQYIQRNNGGRNVFLASATPFENHATEVYNVLSFMARDRMKAMGIYNINDFYTSFANFKTESLQGVDGQFKEKEVMLSFSNLPELQSLIKEFIDRKEDPTLVRPDKKVLTPQLRMSPLQAQIKEQVQGMLSSDEPGALLKATTYMKSNSFSPYFVTEFAPKPKDMYEFVENSPKIKYAMEMLRTIKNDPKTSDRSNFIYIGNEGIQFTDLYVDYLTKEIGYKKDEVGVITGEVSDEVREDIKEKFNNGQIKVLIGGSPTKEGINLQKNGYATFNLSLGWNPTEMAQVEGRVWRQGNDLNKVLIVYPLVENSGDVNIYQKFEEKASRINDLFSYDGPVFDVGEIDPKEKKLLLLTDPVAKANLSIKLDEQKLNQEKLYVESDLSELEKLNAELNDAKRQVQLLPEKVDTAQKRFDDAPEGAKDYYKRELDTAKTMLSEKKDRIKALEKRLVNRDIKDVSARIEELKLQSERVKNSITNVKLQFESLVQKYEAEYEENLRNTKTIEDHKNDIIAQSNDLRVKTPEEMVAEKKRLTSIFEKRKREGEAYILPEKISSIDPARTTEEFKSRIEQLNKFAMARGIMRKVGGIKEKKAGGQFFRKGVDDVTTLGEVRIRKDIPLDDSTYMAVLAHELGHALEYQITGKNGKDTYNVFGKNLLNFEKVKIKEELLANTKEMVGEEKFAENPSYYSSDSELLARFLERHFTEPLFLEKIAPKASEFFLKNAVNNPIIAEYLEAAAGNIDSMQLKFPNAFNFLLDQRQTFQRILGERAGNRAYNTIVRRDAMQARAKSVFEKELKEKFKNIKNVSGVFRSIEAIKETKGDTPVFGTKDYITIEEDEIKEYTDAGWEETDLPSNEGTKRMSIDRYTAEQGEEIFNSLSKDEQTFVKEFTAIKDEAKDFINREVIKDAYGIKSDLEGWIHHFWDDSPKGTGKTIFKTKRAGASKFRKGAEGYVEDAQKALFKSLTELEGAKVFNDWLTEFIPNVTKPLIEGEKPDSGWVEISGDFLRGFLKYGEVKEFVIKDGSKFRVDKARYQMPSEIYEQFGRIADLTEEASTAYAALELMAKFWQVNVLAHPGTAATNAIGGGLQFALKTFTDVYKSILTGDPSIIANDIFALTKSITNWNDVPDWAYGKDSSTFMKDVGNRRFTGKMKKIHGYFDAGSNVVMAPFQFFESYWKKVIARASGAKGLAELDRLTKEGLPPLSDNDRALLDAIEQSIDLYGFNYNNVPNWLHQISTNPIGKLTLPFKRYLYKYTKMLTAHMFSVVNRNVPWQDRLARLLGLATWIGVIAAIISEQDDDRETPEKITANTPRWMSPVGKMMVGKTEEGLEKFVRTVKYPGFNLFSFTKGDVMQGFSEMLEGSSSVGPLAQVLLHQAGFKNDFEKYKETSQLHASTASSFVPFFRVLGDIAQIMDPFKRKTEDPMQEFTRLIPTMDAFNQEKLRGKPYVDKVPTGANSTKDVERKNYAADTALSLLTGIYTTRIDPDVVKAFEKRYDSNEEKKKTEQQWKKSKENIVNTYVQKYKESTGSMKATKLERELKKEIIGSTPKNSPDYNTKVSRATSAIQAFRAARTGDTFIAEIYELSNNSEKVAKFQELKATMTPEEYRNTVLKYFREKLISDELRTTLLRNR